MSGTELANWRRKDRREGCSLGSISSRGPPSTRAVLTLRGAVAGAAVRPSAEVVGLSNAVGACVGSVPGEVAGAAVELAREPAGGMPSSSQPEATSKQAEINVTASKCELRVRKRLTPVLLVLVRGEFISSATID